MVIVHKEKSPVEIKRSDQPAAVVHPERSDCDWQWLTTAVCTKRLKRVIPVYTSTCHHTAFHICALRHGWSIFHCGPVYLEDVYLSHPAFTYFLNQYVRWERQNWTSEDFDLMINAYQTSFSVEINLDEWKTINGTSLKHWTEMTHSTRSVRVAFTCWGGWDLLVRESHCWGPFTSLWWHFCLARALLYPITSMESRGSHRLSSVMDNTFHIRLWRP